jgi:hypothetical protein
VSATICPRRFVMRQSVRSPISQAFQKISHYSWIKIDTTYLSSYYWKKHKILTTIYSFWLVWVAFK